MMMQNNNCTLNYNIAFHCRISWILVVIIVISVFTYAITDRLRHLYTYPTNIDLTVGYWPRVPFPAVTICNQNKYR
jgi:hypothetical protein